MSFFVQERLFLGVRIACWLSKRLFFEFIHLKYQTKTRLLAKLNGGRDKGSDRSEDRGRDRGSGKCRDRGSDKGIDKGRDRGSDGSRGRIRA